MTGCVAKVIRVKVSWDGFDNLFQGFWKILEKKVLCMYRFSSVPLVAAL